MRLLIKFLCVFIPRRGNRKRIRFLLLNRGRLTYSCDIPEISRYLKNGLKLPHPVGVVISKRAEIGRNCSVYQNVTLGARDRGRMSEDEYPTLRDNVTIYAGTVIVGDITVGENSVIGANSVVLSDVPANEIWAGVPAKCIRQIDS